MELRKDYVLDRWVIIATSRASRPQQFKKTEEDKQQGTDFFSPGNEHLTPPEIGRIPDGDSWRMRWFPNKFPAVTLQGDPTIQTHNEFFTFASAYGSHEVITETPDSNKQLWDLDADDLKDLFKLYNERIGLLLHTPNTQYVVVFKNHGKKAGTSIVHSHTQVVSVNFVPSVVKEKAQACRENCPYCSILHIEANSYRRCFENERFVAFTPYASRFSYEIWVFPKEHHTSMKNFDEKDFEDLGSIMNQVLSKLKELNLSYNYYLHYSPKGENLHFHIEITPRVGTWAGFEYATDTIINSVTPEDAAKFYRGEVKPE